MIKKKGRKKNKQNKYTKKLPKSTCLKSVNKIVKKKLWLNLLKCIFTDSVLIRINDKTRLVVL